MRLPTMCVSEPITPVTITAAGDGGVATASSERAASGSLMKRSLVQARSAPGAPWPAPLVHRRQAEDPACLRRCCRPAIVARARIDDLADELGVAGGQPVGLDAQIVLETRAAMPAIGETPLVH